ncbi:SIS domain-containing protein [Paraconexibacter sp.]|uniref:SIS domain-containing protein n=1 Tax=Paraconexibacter sp. TaxID=2949640 RepID=UPI003569098F
MSTAAGEPGVATDSVDGLLAARAAAGWFDEQAPRLARVCHAMAERFARGGRLLVVGCSAADATDVAHVEVEFVHPVIVGKRALPALALETADIALHADRDDIVMAFGDADEVRTAVAAARGRGCLTIAFAGSGAAWEFPAPTQDPFVAQELIETTYHVLWELVHVFFEHRGLLAGRTERAHHDSGASGFLYPFLDEREDDLDAVLGDVADSVRAKAAEAHALRAATLRDGFAEVRAAAAAVRRSLHDGGRLLALGNGGSATDAADIVADFRAPPAGSGWPARPALDLTSSSAVLTAVANDVGVEAIFTRQVIAHGRPGDVLVAISTSGGSRNVLHALAQARRDGLVTVALVGYDGGAVLADRLADHVVVARSEHIPRIQEAQATVLHALRTWVEEPPR